MRKNTLEVFNMWLRGGEHTKQNSIWTNGDTIYSYGTAIVTNGDHLNEAYFNSTKYSKTTTTHQNALAVLLEREGFHVEEMDNLPVGIKGDKFFNEVRYATRFKAGWAG